MTAIQRLSLLLPALFLIACAQVPQRAELALPEPAVDAPDEQADIAEESEPANLPHLELDREMLYHFMLGDLAAQRRNPEMATRLYLDLAESTQDSRVARRAAQLALEAHRYEDAVTALKLWLKLEPDSALAKRGLAAALLSGGRLDEARPHVAALLAAEPQAAGKTLMQLYPMLANHQDKEAGYVWLRDLAAPYPESVETHLVLVRAAEAAGKYDVALDEVRKIRALRPDWELGVLAEAQLLARTDPAQAISVLKNYLETHPGLLETRVFYLGVLMKQKQYPEARELVRKMQAEHPDNFELAFAAAGLSVQMGELDRAESELRATLQNGNQDQNTVYYYLGRLYDEEMARKDDALASYLKVTDGEYAYPAHLRAAFLLYEAGKLSEARARLQQTPTKNDTQRVELLLAESRMLNDTGQPEAAYDVLKRGLEKLPDQPGLLYETAMQAIRLDKHAEFERMMRQVIALSPQQAQAYNAIGYSLLDRNERVKEGVALVKKAYALDPDDPAIMDSMGWAYYRMGDLEKSLEFLRRAYALLPDPEIAAHLGEILWLLDKRDEAKRVWENALAAHPDDAALRAAIGKYQP